MSAPVSSFLLVLLSVSGEFQLATPPTSSILGPHCSSLLSEPLLKLAMWSLQLLIACLCTAHAWIQSRITSVHYKPTSLQVSTDDRPMDLDTVLFVECGAYGNSLS